MNSILIDFDTKVLYDIKQGNDLWWALESLKGHKIIIDHDFGELNWLLNEAKAAKFKERECNSIEKTEKCKKVDIYKKERELGSHALALGKTVSAYLEELNDDGEQIEDFRLEHGIDEESGIWYFVNTGFKEFMTKAWDLSNTKYGKHKYNFDYEDEILRDVMSNKYLKIKSGETLKLISVIDGFQLENGREYDIIKEYDSVYEVDTGNGVYCRPKGFFGLV